MRCLFCVHVITVSVALLLVVLMCTLISHMDALYCSLRYGLDIIDILNLKISPDRLMCSHYLTNVSSALKVRVGYVDVSLRLLAIETIIRCVCTQYSSIRLRPPYEGYYKMRRGVYPSVSL